MIQRDIDVYNEAKKRVKAKKKFYKELSTFVGTSIFLVFINVFTSPYYLWCLWAIVPWGIGLVIQGGKIMASSKSSNWEENEMRKELMAMGKNPDDYLDDRLELRELEEEKVESSKGYRNSDLV
jgi:hypothetical protein